MPEKERSDAMKATNDSLTPPEEDLSKPGRDYPPGPFGRKGREIVQTGPTPTPPPGPPEEGPKPADPAAPHGGTERQPGDCCGRDPERVGRTTP